MVPVGKLDIAQVKLNGAVGLAVEDGGVPFGIVRVWMGTLATNHVLKIPRYGVQSLVFGLGLSL